MNEFIDERESDRDRGKHSAPHILQISFSFLEELIGKVIILPVVYSSFIVLTVRRLSVVILVVILVTIVVILKKSSTYISIFNSLLLIDIPFFHRQAGPS